MSPSNQLRPSGCVQASRECKHLLCTHPVCAFCIKANARKQTNVREPWPRRLETYGALCNVGSAGASMRVQNCLG